MALAATSYLGKQIIVTMTVAAEPTTARFRVRASAASVDTVYTSGTASEVTHPTATTYVLTFVPSSADTWYIRFEGIGANPDADEIAIKVEAGGTVAPAVS